MPFFGEQAKKISDATPQARPNGDDQFIAPLSVPKLPARNYFLFQQVGEYLDSLTIRSFPSTGSNLACALGLLLALRYPFLISLR